jgi:uridylate kinase
MAKTFKDTAKAYNLTKFKLDKKGVLNTVLNSPKLQSQMLKDGNAISNMATSIDGNKYYVGKNQTSIGRNRVTVTYRNQSYTKNTGRLTKAQTLAFLRRTGQVPHGEALITAFKQYYGGKGAN